jgi:hypothetical protein
MAPALATELGYSVAEATEEAFLTGVHTLRRAAQEDWPALIKQHGGSAEVAALAADFAAKLAELEPLAKKLFLALNPGERWLGDIEDGASNAGDAGDAEESEEEA